MTTDSLKHLDLFSGIGGFALAALRTNKIKTIGFCEKDVFCQSVIKKRFPGVSIKPDVRFHPKLSTRVDIITAGFPCQDLSLSNANGRGLEGERSGLFFSLLRVVRDHRPRYLVLENVPGLLSRNQGRNMGTVLWHLSQLGFDAEWQTISAASVGSPQLRKRVFIVAYDYSIGGERCCKGTIRQLHHKAQREDGGRVKTIFPRSHISGPFFWREGDGVPRRMDRLRSLGNSVHPDCAAIPLSRILDLEQARASDFYLKAKAA